MKIYCWFGKNLLYGSMTHNKVNVFLQDADKAINEMTGKHIFAFPF